MEIVIGTTTMAGTGELGSSFFDLLGERPPNHSLQPTHWAGRIEGDGSELRV